jgi:hypothetical protein
VLVVPVLVVPVLVVPVLVVPVLVVPVLAVAVSVVAVWTGLGQYWNLRLAHHGLSYAWCLVWRVAALPSLVSCHSRAGAHRYGGSGTCPPVFGNRERSERLMAGLACWLDQVGSDSWAVGLDQVRWDG